MGIYSISYTLVRINKLLKQIFLSLGVIRLQDFLKEAQKNEWRVQLYQFRPSQAYRDIFWRIKSAGESRIVLDVKRDTLRTVLKHVGLSFSSFHYALFK